MSRAVHDVSELRKALPRLRANDPTLQWIYCNHQEIGDELLGRLAKGLWGNTAVTRLLLGYNKITPEGVRLLAGALRGNTTLETLDLNSNAIGQKGAKSIAAVLRGNTALEMLDLAMNNIGDEGLRWIADALRGNTRLESLILFRNDISDEGVKLLGDALRGNTTLTCLHLSQNKIRDEGIVWLADALRGQTTISWLNIEKNRFGDEAAGALADLIRGNTSLGYVDLKYNNITEEGVGLLVDAMRANTTLKNFNVAQNPGWDTWWKELSHLEETREERAAAAAEERRREAEAPPPAAAPIASDSTPAASSACPPPSPAASVPAHRALAGGRTSATPSASSALCDTSAAATAVPAPVASNGSASSSAPPPAQSRAAATGEEVVQGVAAHGSAREIAFDALQKGDEIGRGGLGVVYRGRWGHEEVALKEATRLTSADIAELLGEAEAMQQLHSPHVVTLYGVALREAEAPHAATAVLVMELMAGGSLHALLHNRQPLPWSRRLQIVTEVAKGLRYMHQVDFMHRDVKSGNVLLDGYGRAKVADFGFARLKHSLSLQSTRYQSAGTPVWMAPELFKRRAKFTAACDVYSFGMLMWEVAARAVPFADAHTPEVAIGWIKEGEKEDIPQDTPPTYAELLQRCWSVDAAARPSMAEAVEALEAMHDVV